MVTENSVRSENAGVSIIREIMVATTVSSIFVALFALVTSSFRTPKEHAASLAAPVLRPALVGSVVALLVWLAAMSADGSARYGAEVAPSNVRLVLDQEIAAASRKAGNCSEHSRPDSAHAPSQSAVGSTPHSRRTAQVGDYGGAIHGGEILASVWQTAFPDLANLPYESSGADCGPRFFHRTDGELPGAVRFRQQMREAFPWEQAPRYLLRDRDAIYGRDMVALTKGMGMAEVITAPRSPWQKDYASHCTSWVRCDTTSLARRRCDSFTPWAFRGGLSPGCSYRQWFLSLQV